MRKLVLSEAPHDIWVVAELESESPTPLTLEMVCGARMAADKMGFDVKVAVLGSGLGDVSAGLIQAGADRVYLLDDPAFAATAPSALLRLPLRLGSGQGSGQGLQGSPRVASHAPWLKALGDLLAGQSPEFVLIGATPTGEELAPRLAQCFGAGLISRCVALRVDDFERAFVGRRAVYGGAYYEVVVTSGPAPQFATVLPGCFGPPYLDASRLGETEVVKVGVGDSPLRSAPGVSESHLPQRQPIDFEMPRPKLKNARRIVSVGRQVGDVELAKQLASALGAEFAGAREAIDEGYIDESQVVGITGARVSPDLYIALGIRGDTLHAFGIQDARFVVAVHPDPDAPIFRQADAGIVGNPAAVASELMRLLRNT